MAPKTILFEKKKNSEQNAGLQRRQYHNFLEYNWFSYSIRNLRLRIFLWNLPINLQEKKCPSSFMQYWKLVIIIFVRLLGTIYGIYNC